MIALLFFSMLVRVDPIPLGSRAWDERPASMELEEPKSIDLNSLKVVRCDAKGEPLEEVAFRFLDKTWPWEFPDSSGPGTQPRLFPRGAFLYNVQGEGKRGLLVWNHRQQGNAASFYRITYRTGATRGVAAQGFVGDGSPRRQPTDASLTGTLYNRVAVADWDGDGRDDLVVGTGLGHVLLYRNHGAKTAPEFHSGDFLRDDAGAIIDAGGMSSPAIADWDGDGKRDLLLGAEGARQLLWYRNLGGNRLHFAGYLEADGKPLLLPAKPCPESPHYKRDYAPSVEVVDWDADGDPDLLLGGYITGYVWFYENLGGGKLTLRGPLEADGRPIDTIWGAHPSAFDADGDGDLDLLTGSFGQQMGGGDRVSDFLIYCENTGTRRSPKLTRRPVPYDGEAPRDILALARPADWNHDGLTDLVISTMTRIYLGQNTGTRSAPKWRIRPIEARWGLSPLSATQIIDLNGDGKLDLIRSSLDGEGYPEVQLQEEKGFRPPQPLHESVKSIAHPVSYGDPWAFTYLVDFDRDGRLDLLWADGPGNVYLHRARGDGGYDTKGVRLMTTEGTPIKVGPPVVPVDQVKDFTEMQGSRAAVAAADFDNDGKIDLVVGDTFGDVYYYAGEGSLFRPGVKLGNLSSRAIPLVYDQDHDGRLDVLGISWSGKMAWYRNLGRHAFGPGEVFTLPPAVAYSPRVVIADWNGDGDDDFLVMSSYPWFCWLEGSFARHGYAKALVVSGER